MLPPPNGSSLAAQFGPYQLRSLIGAGETGQVYRAFDTRSGRVVRLTLLPGADAAFRERFGRECRIAARLREPHIVPLYDFGEIDGVLFVDTGEIGGSLRDLLNERGVLEPKQAAAIVAQVAAALDAAHAVGLVHRDIRPENVLLTDDHVVYLSGFCIGSGSPAYMAPELFGGGRVGPATDVYALACVLYECLTGRPPFECDEPRELTDAHLFSPPPRPSIMRRGIDRELDEVIAQGMAKPPAARFSTAGELARAACSAASWILQPAPTPRTRPFTVSYPNPDDTGSSPYPPHVPSALPGRRFGAGRAPLALAGAAVVLLVVAAVIAATLVVAGHHNGPPAQAASTPPPSATPAPKTPSLSRPVQGADALGFVGQTARCDPGDPPAAVVRTAQSLAVICQTGSGSYDYRGERIRDGAHIELSDAVRSSDGFDAVNPADGVRYEVRPDRLRILSGGHVDSSEPVLQYATAD